MELDTSDCAQRPLTACNDGGITLQNQLDNQLAALLPAETFLLTDAVDDVLVVQFENGCAKRYFSKDRGDALTVVERFAGQQLASLRLRCALALECAEFQGPAASDIQ